MRKLNFGKPKNVTSESFELLNQALEFLSPKQRLIIYLRFWDNMTIQEIARYIGQSWTSTDVMIDSAINHLRVRIIQLSHLREETDLLMQFNAFAA